MRTPRVRRQQSPIKVLALFSAFGVYALVYALSFRQIGNDAGILLTVPVVASAILFGIRGGIAAGLGAIALALVLASGIGDQTTPEWLSAGGGLGSAALILVGVVMGRMVDLQQTTAEETNLRVAAEDALSENDEKFRTLYNLTPVMLHALDGMGLITEVNDYWLETMGYTRQEVIGHKSTEFLTGLSAEDYPRLADVFRRDGIFKNVERQMMTKNGQVIDTLRTSVGIRDAAGKITQVLTFGADITDSKRAEAALRDSEQRYRSLYNQTPVMMHSVDNEGLIKEVNDYWMNTLGYEREEVVGRDPREFYTEESRRDSAAERDGQLRQGGVQNALRQAVKKDGAVIDLAVNGIRVPEDFGQGIRGLMFWADVTERNKADEALRESEERYRRLYNETPVMMYSVGHGSRIVEVNDWWLQVMGYERDEVIGRPSRDFWSKEQLEGRKDSARSAAYTAGLVETDELQYVKKNGEPMDAMITVKYDRDESGAIILTRTSAVDITYRNEAEQAVRESEEKFRSLYNETPVMLHSVDRYGRISQVNDYWLKVMGFTREEVIGRLPKEFSPSQEQLKFDSMAREFLSTGVINKADVMMETNSGEAIHTLRSAIGKRDASGGIVESLVFSADVTEHKRAEAALRESEERFRGLYNNAPVMLHTLEGNQVIAEVNDDWLRRMGYARDEVVGHKITEFLSQGTLRDRGTTAGAFQQGDLQGNLPRQQVTKGGEVVDLLRSVYAERDAVGNIRRVHAFAVDVTEQKSAEEALHASEERFRTLYNKTPVMLYSQGNSGRIVEVNDHWLQIMGYEREEVIGRRLSDFFIEVSDIEWQEKREEFLRTGKLTNVQQKTVTKDGQILDVLAHVERTTNAQTGEVGTLGLWVDMTDLREAERRRTESDKEYRLLIENASDSIVVLQDGKTIYRNQAYVDLLGYTTKETEGRSFLDFVAEEDRDTVRDNYEKRLRGEDAPDEYTVRLLPRDGRHLVLEVRPRQTQFDGDIATLVMMRDITERQRAEQALRASEERYRRLYHNAPVMLHSTDAQNRIEDVNELWLKTTGYERNEVIGHKIAEFLTPVSRKARSQGMDAFRETGMVHGAERQQVKKNGDVIDILRTAVAERNEAGDITNIHAFAADITERKVAEQALRDSEERYRTLYNNTPVMLHSTDDRGRMEDVNDYWLSVLGYTREEVIGRDAREFVPTQAHGQYNEMVKEFFKAGSVNNKELHFITKEGEVLDTLRSAVGMRDESGRIYRTLVFSADVTERKRAEQALRDSEERYRHMYNNSPVMMNLTDGDGVLTEVNDYWLDVMGYTRAEVVGRSVREFFTMESHDASLAERETIASEGGFKNRIRHAVKKGGEVADILATAVREPGGVDKDVRTLAFWADVTEYNRSQEALRDSEERYRQLVELAPEGILAHVQGRIVFANSAATRIFGANSVEEIVGRQMLDFFASAYQEAMGQRLEQVYAPGGSVPFIEVQITRLDGSIATVEIAAASIIYEGQSAAQTVVRDITDRKEAEAALHDYQTRLHAVLNTVGEGIVAIEPDGTIVMANAEVRRIFGYEGEELLGGNIRDLVPEELRDVHDIHIESFEGSETPHLMADRGGIEGLRKDGTEFPVEISITRTHIGEQKLFIGAVRDVTQQRQAEEALQASEERYRLLYNDTPVMMYSIDPEGIMTSVSEHWLQAMGYEREEVIGRHFSDFLTQESRQVLRETRAQFYIDAGFREAARQIIKKNGEVMDVLLTAYMETDERGEHVQSLAFWVDVTERKRAEAALQASEERYRLLYNDTPVMMYSTDPEGHMTSVSEHWLQVMEYEREEVIGRPFRDFMALESRQGIEDRVPGFLANRGYREAERQIIRKNGELIDVLLTAYMETDERGEHTQTLAFWVDVTERNRTEEALRASETENRRILDLIPDMLFRINSSGEFLDYRGAPQGLAVPTEEFMERSIGDIMPPEFSAMLNPIIAETLREGELQQFEYQMAIPLGSENVRDFEARMVAASKDSVLSVVRDVTERKDVERARAEAREAALEASRAKSRFLASMSHEIRTPMNAIIGMADLLADSPLTEQQQEFVRVFHSAGDNLMILINDILDFSKIEAGQITIENGPLDLGTLIDDTTEFLGIRAREKGITLTTHIAADVVIDRLGDPLRLRQVLINLLGNAIKFTQTGTVTVSVERETAAPDNAGVLFRVTDTGIGIAPEKMNDLFEAFTQADASTTREFGGTGLGLTISRQLVELMDGEIHVESAVGRGSTFSISLPLVIVQEPSTDAKLPVGLPIDAARRTASTEGRGELSEMRHLSDGEETRSVHILLAEDSADNRMLIQAFLEKTDYVMDVAENGQFAYEMFTTGDYDLVLMDVQMPMMDGYTATRTIRAWEQEHGTPATPIVALTANAFEEDIQASLEAGCTAHLTKPIRLAALIQAIEEHTGSDASP